MKRIIAFAGSNSNQSINKKTVEYSKTLFKEVEVEVLDLVDYPAPIYGIDLEHSEGFPESMILFQEKLKSADGYLVSTPEHNGSMPAVLKNTIDWISRMQAKVFSDKPTVFLSVSPGARGGASALNHLVTIMPYRGANIIGSLSIGNFSENFVGGELIPEIRNQLLPIIEKLEEAVLK